MPISSQNYQKVGLNTSLLFATLGLFLAFLLLVLLGGAGILAEFPVQILVGVGALYLAAAGLGKLAGFLIYRRHGKGFGIWLIGIGLAWLCLLAGCLAGSSVEFLKTDGRSQDFIDYIFKPLVWVMFSGAIPALLLGTAYTAIVKKRLAEDRIPNPIGETS